MNKLKLVSGLTDTAKKGGKQSAAASAGDELRHPRVFLFRWTKEVTMMIKKWCATGMALSLTFSLGFVSAKAAVGPDSRPTGIFWPEQQELPSFAEAEHLDVADVERVPGEERLMLASLQGIVNREKPRIYLAGERFPEEGKLTWLNSLNVPYTLYDNHWEIVNRYISAAKGLVIYDPDVPDTINVATTLAGLKDALAVGPGLAERMKAEPYRLPVLEDLRGKFRSRTEAYAWQLEHLWPQATHRMLIGIPPTVGIALPPGIPPQFKTLAEETRQIRDASNRKTYELDLSEFLGKEAVYVRFDDAFPNDGWGPAVHQVTIEADGQTIGQFVANTDQEKAYLYDGGGSVANNNFNGHRFADNTRYFVYRFVPPEGTKRLVVSVDMWNQFKVSATNVQPARSGVQEPYAHLRDYAVANRAMVFWLAGNTDEDRAIFERILSETKPGSPYLGWFPNDVAGEFSGVELASRHGVYVLAADWFSNMSAWSGTRANFHAGPKQPPAAPALQNKIYVSFVFSEGDNLQYNEHRLRKIWDDPQRGKVPITWGTSPLLADAAPAMLDYYMRTATLNDLLIAGPSGPGYFYPAAWPDDGFSDFLHQAGKYMKRTGMDIPYVLNRLDNREVPLAGTKAEAYIRELDPPGVYFSWSNRFGVELVNGTLPQSTVRGTGSVQEANAVLAQAAAGWDGKSPMFVSIGLYAWNMTPSDAVKIAESLGPQFEVVRGDHYFELIREAYGLKKNQ